MLIIYLCSGIKGWGSVRAIHSRNVALCIRTITHEPNNYHTVSTHCCMEWEDLMALPRLREGDETAET